MQRWRAKQRNEAYVYEYLRRHPCIDCGEEDPIVLDFDHVDPSTKHKGISELKYGQCSLRLLRHEIAKCVVRCANCHRRKTVLMRDWEAVRRGHGKATPQGELFQ